MNTTPRGFTALILPQDARITGTLTLTCMCGHVTEHELDNTAPDGLEAVAADNEECPACRGSVEKPDYLNDREP